MSPEYTKTETPRRPSARIARPPPGPEPIRVIVAEGSNPIRQFLGATLTADEGFELVETCSDWGQLQTALRDKATDVLVTDVRMPASQGDGGIRSARRLAEAHPRTGVVLLGQYAEPAYVLALLESRAGRAYLLKERLCEQGELINAVTTVARGGIVLDAEVVRSLIQARELAATSPLPRLDRDERELLELIVRGKCDEAIAQDHDISERTVTRRAKAICEKLGLPEPEDARRRAQHALAYLAGDGG